MKGILDVDPPKIPGPGSKTLLCTWILNDGSVGGDDPSTRVKPETADIKSRMQKL